MLIDILAIGSRGDVQPYVALGLGLRDAGHRVRIVTLGGFEDFVRVRGLEHLVIGSSPPEIANSAAGRNWIKHRSSTAGFLRGFVKVARSRVQEGISRYWQDRRDAEALIVSPMGLLAGIHIAERLGVPVIQAQVEPPAAPTRYDWNGRTSLMTSLRGAGLASLHTVFHFLIWSALHHTTNEARRQILGLPPVPLIGSFIAMHRKRLPLLCGYSSAVVPKLPDFGDWIHNTGYWFLDDVAGWEPSTELVDFLNSGPPPVFVGLGSTPFPNPGATTELVVRAVTRAGYRGIVVAGGSGLATGRLAANVLSVNSLPYSWLLPQVCAAVHQGGAGVTAAALRAGLPCVVVPVFGIHPFWANRVFHLGAGPAPIPASRITEDNLANAIQATANEDMRRRAAALGERIRGEDGVGRAIEIIHRHLGVEAPNRANHQHAR